MSELQPTPPAANNQTSRIIIIILSLAVIGLGAAFIYNFMGKQKAETENIKLAETNEELETQIDDLQEEIKTMDANLADANKKAEEKSEELKKLQAKISAYMGQIEKLKKEGKFAQSEKEKFQGKYQQLVFYNNKYRVQIEELEKEIARLKMENDSLRGQVSQTKETVQAVKEENKELATKVEMAKLLIASDFNFVGINKRGKRLEVDDIRAKKIKTLQICFTVNRNPIVSPVRKEVYIVVQDPNTSVYQSMATSSGYFTLNGKKTVYTAKGTVKYDGSQQNVCVDYVVPDENSLKSGSHVCNVYTTYENSDEAYLLGTHKFEIK